MAESSQSPLPDPDNTKIIRRGVCAHNRFQNSRADTLRKGINILVPSRARKNFEIAPVLHFQAEIQNLTIGLRPAANFEVLARNWTLTCSPSTAMAIQREKADALHQRLIKFGARTTRVARTLPRTREGRYTSDQFIRSGLAAAANYAEARAAESRADFVHKLRVVLKELNESGLSLRLAKCSVITLCLLSECRRHWAARSVRCTCPRDH